MMAQINVMIVDDEEQFLISITKLLEKNNFNVIKTSEAVEAIGLLEWNSVDVVVLDVKMPEINGLEALKIIKQLDPTTQVIILTGHATVEAAIEGIKLGAFDYIMKPAEIEVIVARIKDAYFVTCQMRENKHQHEAGRPVSSESPDIFSWLKP